MENFSELWSKDGSRCEHLLLLLTGIWWYLTCEASIKFTKLGRSNDRGSGVHGVVRLQMPPPPSLRLFEIPSPTDNP